MFSRLLLVFILLPLADLILIWMMLRTNVLATVLWILLSGIMGAWYVRRQGTHVVAEIRKTVGQNQVPTNVLIEGGLVILAGGLLITPGLLTDIFGFSMLVKPCRRWYRQRILNWLKKKVTVHRFDMGGQQPKQPDDVMDATVVGRKETDPVPESESAIPDPKNIETSDVKSEEASTTNLL